MMHTQHLRCSFVSQLLLCHAYALTSSFFTPTLHRNDLIYILSRTIHIHCHNFRHFSSTLSRTKNNITHKSRKKNKRMLFNDIFILCLGNATVTMISFRIWNECVLLRPDCRFGSHKNPGSKNVHIAHAKYVLSV